MQAILYSEVHVTSAHQGQHQLERISHFSRPGERSQVQNTGLVTSLKGHCQVQVQKLNTLPQQSARELLEHI